MIQNIVLALIEWLLQYEQTRGRTLFRDAIQTAISSRDQRGLETADMSGKPSGKGQIRTRVPEEK